MNTHATYTLQLVGTISAPQLSQTVKFRTDEDAIDCAKQMAESFVGVRWFMAVRVWRGEDVVVATVTLNDRPVVNVKLGG